MNTICREGWLTYRVATLLIVHVRPGPCSHTGPCDQSNPDCTCVEESVRCSRSCQCGVNCVSLFTSTVRLLIPYSGQRREGCRCVLTPKARSKMQRSQTCATFQCTCRKRGWECDPWVCECDNVTFLKSSKKGALLYESWSILGAS